MKKLLAILGISFLICSTTSAQESKITNEKKQFAYVLKLIPRLLIEANWTTQDQAIVGKHFRRLQQLHKEGKVILAGRSINESEPTQFGIVIFEAGSIEEARKMMEDDDAVREKIMTAQLFPFSVALIR